MTPDLKSIAQTIRRHIITSTTAAGSGHPTSSMSAADIAVALYFGGILHHDPKNPSWPDRDRFILSKGHAAPLLYAVLAEAGYFPVEDLQTLRKLGSPLEGHPNIRRLPGVEASTGSLGQGLSIGLGHALAARSTPPLTKGGPGGVVDSPESTAPTHHSPLTTHHSTLPRVYVLLGDGEINQGQVWEAAMAAVKFKADNLIAIIDHNGYQQTGPSTEVLDLRPISAKWAAFGWSVQDIDGHDMDQVVTALNKARETQGRPSVIVAKTVKGHPIIHLLSEQNYHGKPLSPADAEKALAVL